MDRNFTDGIVEVWRVVGMIIAAMLIIVGIYELAQYLINHLHIFWK